MTKVEKLLHLTNLDLEGIDESTSKKIQNILSVLQKFFDIKGEK